MPTAVSQVFVSHSTQDAASVDALVERLRDHYITTWYAPRNIRGGYFLERIKEAIAACDWFLVALSPAALASDWVRTEVEIALKDDRLRDRILPVLVTPCDWTSAHPLLDRYQLFDLTTRPKEAEARLLRYLGVEPHTFPPVQVGDVKVPVYVFVGGDGRTRFRPGDVVCDGPGDASEYAPPDDVAAFAAEYLPRREAECRSRQQVFTNNRQVRLAAASWGSPSAGGGLDNRPLRLTLGWTRYYHTAVTNMKTDERLPDGRTIHQKYAAPVNDLADCRMSNPIATNLSVVTSDGFIFYALRSPHVAWNVGGLQPAVSGDGQPEDVGPDGVYDPFRTACREGCEEATGEEIPPTPDQVTFFGLARTMKTRFPFLFGEIRTPMTARQLLSQTPKNAWEGRLQPLPFTVEAVTAWVAERYQDQYFGRAGAAIGTTLFALLQSLRYEYPNRWPEVVDRLDLPEVRPAAAVPRASGGVPRQ